MGVAASRNGAASARVVLRPDAQLLVVADGFGRIDGVPIANAAVARLRVAIERRARSERFARALDRPEPASALLAAEIAKVNEALFARSASNQDYVSAGCSLTAALIVRRRVILAHVGATSAHLTGGGRSRSLTPHHVASAFPVRLLTRALGAYGRVEPALAAFDADDGDALVLCDARERKVLEHRFEASTLVVPFGAVRDRLGAIGPAAAAAFFAIAMLCVR